ncbi:hypothetical protein FHS19_000633 [Paenibacillus rhizosphaerae]|uniref:Uncharacterized protein n=1 Tax=Paenibacillus rhizosphaerae TaxID=297318 RepID=A0A839TKS7_9BACL|nr:hypothetical protein [Paenibacillus rhizosphaerae]MBB3125979.1 hypothetical protein [Paenibacillus rhizosphaerae]
MSQLANSVPITERRKKRGLAYRMLRQWNIQLMVILMALKRERSDYGIAPLGCFFRLCSCSFHGNQMLAHHSGMTMAQKRRMQSVWRRPANYTGEGV